MSYVISVQDLFWKNVFFFEKKIEKPKKRDFVFSNKNQKFEKKSDFEILQIWN